jgi:hypothetical protein
LIGKARSSASRDRLGRYTPSGDEIANCLVLYLVQTAEAVTSIEFPVPRSAVITPVAIHELAPGLERTIATRDGWAVSLFLACAPPPSKTLPAGQLAVAVTVVSSRGEVETLWVPIFRFGTLSRRRNGEPVSSE